MNYDFTVLQGKAFDVELPSRLGSTNYGWCVTSLPKEIVLAGMEQVSYGDPMTTPTLQIFHFGVVSCEEVDVKINFSMFCFTDFTKEVKKVCAKIHIVPSDSDEFVKYEQEDLAAIPYGFVNTNISAMKYGYPRSAQIASSNCGSQFSKDASLYGMTCNNQDALMKYGYPCGVQDASLKYGYPCLEASKDARPYGMVYDSQDSLMKYGYPCGVQDASLKYGYPCLEASKDARPYGMVYDSQDSLMKYGYPCGVQDASLKYGYPCLEASKDARPYGYPF